MIYRCKLICLFSSFIFPKRFSFPIYRSGYFYFLLSLVCSRLVEFSILYNQTNTEQFLFPYLLSILLLFFFDRVHMYVCCYLMNLLNSFSSIYDLHLYIHIHKLSFFSCSLCHNYLLFFFREKTFSFIPITSVCVSAYLGR